MVLRYRQDGSFRVMQLTDLHLGPFANNDNDLKTLELIEKATKFLKPDLIIITGDLIWSQQIDNPKDTLEVLYKLLNESNIPVALTYGNHDSETDYSRNSLRKLERLLNNHVEKKHAFIIDDKESYCIEVYSHDGTLLNNLIYIIDSGDYPKIDLGLYDWVQPKQVEWFNRTNEVYSRSQNGKKDLIFLHIPVPEYYEAKENILDGVCEEGGEVICSPKINTGLFSSAVINQSIHSFYCGHDHDNNFCGQYYGIQLCYGQITGFNSYGHLERGVRLIDIDEAGIKSRTITNSELNKQIMEEK